ncbi:Ycf66 family protein [Synechococcus sp. RS9916]|uniref:Ycf66 family protein n=1 Tax=Synechococcus sp. RS9916 TaxID=221359 RepID=UPI0000E53822|nr:Ycf66 family protein [Synechococcus sp. RS9916]EAU74863.1 hypothetical protein RS9916_35187 [Synechococcus sp. RS9916]
MVNASLNWASIVGIVLAVGGALLYFMRSFKPALARDYDVFFAAIGLLCGGILFFQGWRLDPILQFGQFLLASTTVFFAYESVRLRGVSTEQARRSAYFDDEPAPVRDPAGGLNGGWDSSYDRFDNPEPQPLRRRFQGSADEGYGEQDGNEQDFYRPRRPSRAAIPEQAASRRRNRDKAGDNWDERSSERERRMARFGQRDDAADKRPSFGERRDQRQDQRRGSRPSATRMSPADQDARTERSPASATSRPSGIPQGSPLRQGPEDAAFSPSDRARRPGPSGSGPSRAPSAQTASRPEQRPQSNRSEAGPTSASRPAPRSSRPRDNSSRFDD